MSGIVALVNAISTDVNAKLVAAGLPPLVDGGIVLGRVKLDEVSAAPRVVMIPKGGKIGPKAQPNRQPQTTLGRAQNPGASVRSITMTQYGGNYTSPTVTFSGGGGSGATAVPIMSGSSIRAIALTSGGTGYTSAPTVTISDTGAGTGATATANLGYTPEKLSQVAQRAIYTDTVIFEVHVWGVASPQDPSNDFDAAQLLYQQVIASGHLLAPNIIRPGSGTWTDGKTGVMTTDVYGREYVFTLEIDTPLLDEPLVTALTFAPPGVQFIGDLNMVQANDATPVTYTPTPPLVWLDPRMVTQVGGVITSAVNRGQNALGAFTPGITGGSPSAPQWSATGFNGGPGFVWSGGTKRLIAQIAPSYAGSPPSSVVGFTSVAAVQNNQPNNSQFGTVVMTYRDTDVNSAYQVVTEQAAGARLCGVLRLDETGVNQDVNGVTAGGTAPFVLTTRFDGTTYTVRVNGAQVYQSTTVTTGNMLAQDFVVIGGMSDAVIAAFGDDPFVGSMGMNLIFAGALSTQDINHWEQVVAQGAGLTLPTGSGNTILT